MGGVINMYKGTRFVLKMVSLKFISFAISKQLFSNEQCLKYRDCEK